MFFFVCSLDNYCLLHFVFYFLVFINTHIALTIANYSQSINNDVDIICFTYGSPRWANSVLANYFGTQITTHWRLTNEHDVVPTVPREDDNYHHTWTQIWYKSDSPLTFVQCDGSGEDPACEYIGDSVYDHLHYMGIYETCQVNDTEIAPKRTRK